jgi:hypothetical protein
MSRLNEMEAQAPVASAKEQHATPIAGEIKLGNSDPGVLSKITFGDLYVFIFKVFLATAAVLAPFVLIYLALTSK